MMWTMPWRLSNSLKYSMPKSLAFCASAAICSATFRIGIGLDGGRWSARCDRPRPASCPAHALCGPPCADLRRPAGRHLMHQMAVDIDQAGAVRLLVHQMVVPDLVVEGARFHDSNALLRLKGKAACKRPASPAGGRSKPRLHRRQPAEKPPRQPRMIGEDDPLSFGNHGGYIANRSGFDNERATKKKGPTCGPFMHCGHAATYSLAAASAASGPVAPCASEMRAFLPRSPRR